MNFFRKLIVLSIIEKWLIIARVWNEIFSNDVLRSYFWITWDVHLCKWRKLFFFSSSHNKECICINEAGRNTCCESTRCERALMVRPRHVREFTSALYLPLHGIPVHAFHPSPRLHCKPPFARNPLYAPSLLSDNILLTVCSAQIPSASIDTYSTVLLYPLWIFVFSCDHYAINNLTHNFYVEALTELARPSAAYNIASLLHIKSHCTMM
jgi:hypothetical protein